MLNWLTGSQAPTNAGPSNNNKQEHEHKKTSGQQQAAENRKDASSEDGGVSDTDTDTTMTLTPDTPPAMFAVKAFRTAFFGTPGVPKQKARPARKKIAPKSKNRPNQVAKEEPEAKPVKGYKCPSASEDSDIDTQYPPAPIPFKLSPRSSLFDPTSTATSSIFPASLASATPVKVPSSPTKSILVTPGAALRPKKNVVFHPDIGDRTPPIRGARIRSGLPNEFPGKFPSPWTPKVGSPSRKRASSWSSGKPSGVAFSEDEDQPLARSKRPMKNRLAGDFEVTENTSIIDYLGDSDNDSDIVLPSRETDVTVDMNDPRSASGKYWKEASKAVENLAVSKVEKLQTRCRMATGYAKKKDELCVELGEKLREVIEKNKKLKSEFKRFQIGSPPSTSGADEKQALGGDMASVYEKDAELAAKDQEIKEQQKVLHRYEERIRTFEEMLDSREDRITELSMSLYHGDDNEDLNEIVSDLRKKLRKATMETRDMGLLRTQSKDLKEKTQRLEGELEGMNTEKQLLQSEIQRLRDDSDDQSQWKIKPHVEDRLKHQIESLEKEKRELKIEMRNKAADDAKEKRDVEKKWRNEVTDLKGKVAAAEWESRKVKSEMKELNNYLGRLEKDLERSQTERDELKKKLKEWDTARPEAALGDDENLREWQVKQRTTLQELRQAKEECSSLRWQKNDADDALQQAKTEIRGLKKQLGSKPERPTENLSVIAEPKYISPGSSSDDSALDRTYDRKLNSPDAVKSAPSIKELFPTPPPIVNLPPSPFRPLNQQTTTAAPSTLDTPLLAKPQRPLSSLDINDQSSILPDFASVLMDTPVKPLDKPTTPFRDQRRLRASPRASIVNISITPPPGTGRKVSGVGRIVPGSAAAKRRPGGGIGDAASTAKSTTTARSGMDPAKREATRKRLEERKRAKLVAASGKENA